MSGDLGSAAPDQRLWRFSLDRYGRVGVPPLCLALQETTGADVNLLLCALWLGSEGHLLTEAQARNLLDAVAPWHDTVVRPLRAVRRRLKGWQICPDLPRERLRAEIQRQEIEAERLEQDLLFAACEGFYRVAFGADRAMLMAQNLDGIAALAPGGAGAAETRAALVDLCL